MSMHADLYAYYVSVTMSRSYLQHSFRST